MIGSRKTLALFLGALLAVVLQLVLAPNIAIFSAMPNFVVAFCLLLAVINPTSCGSVLPFVLGLISDFVVGTPLGSTALLCVLFSFLASRVFMLLDNDTFFIPLLVFVISALLIELFMGAFYMAFGMDVGIIDMLIYRALPCALYDCVAGLVFYPLAAKVYAPAPLSSSSASVHL